MIEQNNENIVNNPSVAPMQTTNVVSVNSRVGFAALISLGVVWVLSYVSAGVLYVILVNFFGLEKILVAERVIILIAISVPLVPIFWFSNRRLNKMLVENTSNLEDANLKKQIRRSLKWAIIIGVIFITYDLYTMLSIMFLDKTGNAGQSFISLLSYGSAFGFIALYSWNYYKKMKS